MGGAPSQLQQVKTGFIAPVTKANAAKQVAPNDVVKNALLNNNQIILEEDVTQKIKQVSNIFKTLNDNDYKGLLQHIDTVNNRLEESAQIKLTDNVKSTLLNFHTAILNNIDTSTMSDTAKNEKFVEIMKGKPDDVMGVLAEKFGKDLEQYKNTLLSSYGIADNAVLKTNVEQIMNSVKSLKVKYKFFEYKYIELNIFMILFIQHAYDTIEAFVKNVLAFNNLRDHTREKLVQETLQVMMNIISSADLEIQPSDFDHLSQSMSQLQQHTDKKTKELEESIRQLQTGTTDSLNAFIRNLSNDTKTKLKTELNNQTGGFVRGSTQFPKAFYDIDNVSMPPSNSQARTSS